MKKPQHVSDDLLVRFLDDELPASDASTVEQHLNTCAECKHRYHRLGGVSKTVESFVAGISPEFSAAERDALVVLLNTDVRPSAHPSQKVFQRFAWGMALAASLVLGMMFAPQLKQAGNKIASADLQQPPGLLEVDGETFVPLPYSNPDLPMAAHHIVQMQVPVSSLADAGVHFEPISSEVTSSDESVLADVLLGIDGQPLGVHVLGFE
jgi:anti-sigma factor RsiW